MLIEFYFICIHWSWWHFIHILSSTLLHILGFHSIPRDTKDNKHSGHVGVRNKRNSQNSYVKSYTNMAAMTWGENQQLLLTSSFLALAQRKHVQFNRESYTFTHWPSWPKKRRQSVYKARSYPGFLEGYPYLLNRVTRRLAEWPLKPFSCKLFRRVTTKIVKSGLVRKVGTVQRRLQWFFISCCVYGHGYDLLF